MAVARYNCDYCNNMVYDEEMEEYVCDVDMDEDDYARLLTSEYRECPYYQSNVYYHKMVLIQIQIIFLQSIYQIYWMR